VTLPARRAQAQSLVPPQFAAAGADAGRLLALAGA
jgi:hypothetical protein